MTLMEIALIIAGSIGMAAIIFATAEARRGRWK